MNLDWLTCVPMLKDLEGSLGDGHGESECILGGRGGGDRLERGT